MNSKLTPNLEKELEEIWHQVPPDYYQNGVSKNLLQRIWHTKKLKTALELIDSSGAKPKNILDVGCASGWMLSKISEKYPKAQYTGVDVYKKAIEYGQKLYKNLRLISVDAHKLPFKDKFFDLVICTELLEHVQNPQKVLSEIKRILVPNGIAIVEMDSGNFLFRMVWYWWTNVRNGVWKDSHIHTFNTKILENMIKDCGFVIKQKKVFNITMAVAFLLGKNEKNN